MIGDAQAHNSGLGNMVAGRKYNLQFAKPGTGPGWTSNFQL
jgi:hypothetical protein